MVNEDVESDGDGVVVMLCSGHKTSTWVTSRFHVQHQGPVPSLQDSDTSLQDYYLYSRFHEDDVSKGVCWHGYPIPDTLAPIQSQT